MVVYCKHIITLLNEIFKVFLGENTYSGKTFSQKIKFNNIKALISNEYKGKRSPMRLATGPHKH